MSTLTEFDVTAIRRYTGESGGMTTAQIADLHGITEQQVLATADDLVPGEPTRILSDSGAEWVLTRNPHTSTTGWHTNVLGWAPADNPSLWFVYATPRRPWTVLERHDG